MVAFGGKGYRQNHPLRFNIIEIKTIRYRFNKNSRWSPTRLQLGVGLLNTISKHSLFHQLKPMRDSLLLSQECWHEALMCKTISCRYNKYPPEKLIDYSNPTRGDLLLPFGLGIKEELPDKRMSFKQ